MNTDTAALAAIDAATRELQLPQIRTEAERLGSAAQRDHVSYLGFLAEVLALEVDARSERRKQRRVVEARFPRNKRLTGFDLDAAPTVNPATIATLATGSYLDAGEPVCLLGDSGTGKTHLLIGLGIAACEQGRRVRYVTAAQLVNELVEAPTAANSPASSPATDASICSASTNSATCNSTPAAPNCCSRSSPNAKRKPRSRSLRTCRSANGET